MGDIKISAKAMIKVLSCIQSHCIDMIKYVLEIKKVTSRKFYYLGLFILVPLHSFGEYRKYLPKCLHSPWAFSLVWVRRDLFTGTKVRPPNALLKYTESLVLPSNSNE